MERDPILATQMGLHQWDHLLPKGTREFEMEGIRILKEFRERLGATDVSGEKAEGRIEKMALEETVDLWLFQAEELRFWEQIPEGTLTLGGAIFPLIARDFAPASERLRNVRARLEAAVPFLEETKGKVTSPVRLWSQIALESGRRLPAFLQAVKAVSQVALSPEEHAKMEEALSRVTEAVADYDRWIEGDLIPRATEHPIIGEERFRRMVGLRGLGISVEEIYELGQKYLAESKTRLESLKERVKPGASVEEAKELVKENRPKDFPAALEAYRESIARAKRFVVEKRLATIPPGEDLVVQETPTYLRHLIPFAAYFPPGRFEKRQVGIYLVTPPEDLERGLREHNFPSILNTTVHEAYPGHHLHFVGANRHPSLARALIYAPETIEGWAHYCEDLMQEHGFHNSPEAEFAQCLDTIWRAARIIIDVDLHCGRMGFQEAVAFLTKEAGMEESSAMAEVKRYTQYPTYQLSYLVGKHLIRELRDYVQRERKEEFTEGFFHDTLLYAGTLQVHYLRELFEARLAAMREADARLRESGG